MEKASFIAEEESAEPAAVEEHIVLALFTGSFSDPSPTARGKKKKKKTCSLYELLRYAEKERKKWDKELKRGMESREKFTLAKALGLWSHYSKSESSGPQFF